MNGPDSETSTSWLKSQLTIVDPVGLVLPSFLYLSLLICKIEIIMKQSHRVHVRIK